MATVKYSDLSSEVLTYLSGNTLPHDPLIEAVIKQSVIEFCRKSWIWRNLPDPIDVVANESLYDVDAPNGSNIVAVIKAFCDGTEIESKSTDWLDSNIREWRTRTGWPSYYTQVDLDQLILAPVPDSSITNGLTLTLALQPSASSTGFPEWICNKYRYDIIDGALSRLMAMPGKSWTDQNTALYHLERFKNAYSSAKASAAIGMSRMSLRTSSVR